MTLGERIAYYRGKLGLSQGELAEQLGVSRQAVSKWETDAGLPDLERLIALSRLYHITLDELVKGESPEETAEAPEEIPVDAVIAKPAAPSGQKTIGYILLGVGLLCAVLVLYVVLALRRTRWQKYTPLALGWTVVLGLHGWLAPLWQVLGGAEAASWYYPVVSGLINLLAAAVVLLTVRSIYRARREKKSA